MKHLKNVKRAHESIEFQIQQWCLISSFYKSSSLISGRCFDPCLVFENVRPVDFIERTHTEVCQQLNRDVTARKNLDATSAMVGRICPPGGDRVKVSETLVAPVVQWSLDRVTRTDFVSCFLS